MRHTSRDVALSILIRRAEKASEREREALQRLTLARSNAARAWRAVQRAQAEMEGWDLDQPDDGGAC